MIQECDCRYKVAANRSADQLMAIAKHATARNFTRLFAAALIATGLFMAAFGNAWAPLALASLPASALGGWLELIVPFLPMAFISSGAALFVATKMTSRS